MEVLGHAASFSQNAGSCARSRACSRRRCEYCCLHLNKPRANTASSVTARNSATAVLLGGGPAIAPRCVHEVLIRQGTSGVNRSGESTDWFDLASRHWQGRRIAGTRCSAALERSFRPFTADMA